MADKQWIELPDGTMRSFPADMTDAEILAELNPEVEAYMHPVGLAENLLSGATGAIGNVVGYPAGAVHSAFSGAEAGEETRTGIRDAMTYEPRTDAAKQQMQALGEFIAPAVEKYGPPVKEFMDDIEKTAVGATGSETAGYLMKNYPLAALDALGLKGVSSLAKAPKKPITLIDDAGRPTKELRTLLERNDLEFEALTPAARARIPRSIDESALVPSSKNQRALSTEVLTDEVAAGGTQAGTAKYGVLDPEGQRLLTGDRVAQEALHQGWDKPFVGLVKQANPETRKVMRNMLDRKRQELVDEKPLMEGLRPSDFAGDAMMDRYRFVRQKMDEARLELDRIAKNDLKGKSVDVQPALDAMAETFGDLKIKVAGKSPSGKPILDFSDSIILKDRSAQRVIKDVLDLMGQGGKPDAARLHDLKRQIDALVEYSKTPQKGLTPKGEKFAKQMRSIINDQLRSISDDYARVNDVLSEGLDIIDEFRSAVGKRVDFASPKSDRAIGRELRKLFSNYRTREQLDNVVVRLDDMSSRLGGDYQTNVHALSRFANALDDRFGASAKTSFQGDIESAGKNVVRDIPMSKSELAVHALQKGADKMRGVSAPRAFETMEDLLRRGVE